MAKTEKGHGNGVLCVMSQAYRQYVNAMLCAMLMLCYPQQAGK